jgi:hypothetical protein
VAKCPLCGFASPEGEPFCALCGAAVPVQGGPPEGGPTRRGFVVLPGGERLEVGGVPMAVGREHLRPYAGPEGAGLISRAHFTVARRDGRFLVEDRPGPGQPKASANGTWLRRPGEPEETRVGAPVELRGGEAIVVARVVTLAVEVEGG